MVILVWGARCLENFSDRRGDSVESVVVGAWPFQVEVNQNW